MTPENQLIQDLYEFPIVLLKFIINFQHKSREKKTENKTRIQFNAKKR